MVFESSLWLLKASCSGGLGAIEDSLKASFVASFWYNSKVSFEYGF
jgi:hypothetical protein